MIVVDGLPLAEAEQLAERARPGIDGVASRQTGSRGTRFELSSISGHSSAAAAELAAINYTNAQGTPVTVVDEYGATWSDVVVLGVGDVRIKAVSNSAGGPAGTTHLVFAHWMMRTTS